LFVCRDRENHSYDVAEVISAPVIGQFMSNNACCSDEDDDDDDDDW